MTDIFNRFGLSLQIIKTAFAAAISWLIATNLLHSEYPYFAAVAAIITVQVTVADSVDKASQRIIGIIGGVLLSMLLGHWFKIGAISIFFIIVIGMGIAKALRMNQQIISQVAISSLLVMAFGQTKEGYALERIIETIIGSAVALFINALIIPRNAVPDVERSILSFSKLSAITLNRLATLLDYTEPLVKTGRPEVNLLITETEKCRKSLDLAEQSLKYNPLLTYQRVRLSHLVSSIHQLESITIQIRGIRRGLVDLQTNQTFPLDPNFVQQLKLAITATASCIAAYGPTILQATDENLNSLDKAISEALFQQDQCLKMLSHINTLPTLRDTGSILTDLGRIVSETKIDQVKIR